MMNPSTSGMAGRKRPAAARLLLAGAVLALLAGGLASCGKRGDPYRPSEVPAAEAPKSSS